MNAPQSYQFSNLEEYAIAMIIFNGFENLLYPPNRYLWDLLPNIYITHSRLIYFVARENSIFKSGIDLSKWTLDNVIL